MPPGQMPGPPPYPPQYPSYRPPRAGFPIWAVILIGCAGLLFLMILILAAILFPVFSQARAKARATACMSNEKQMALGTLMYVQDYDQHMPPSNAWMDEILPYVSKSDSNPFIYHCPEVAPASSPNASTDYGYAFNSKLSKQDTSKIAEPNQTLMLYDSTNLSRSATDPGVSIDVHRHQSYPNLGYMDGHVTHRAKQ